MIRVAQAGSDERYQYEFGQAGDQRKGTPDKDGCFTGELNVQPWYNKPWDCVLRPKSATVANAIAGNAELICRNKNVGYDQNQDETLWDSFDKLGWSPLSIAKLPLCETDCCRLVDVCIRLAGITDIPDLKHKYTGNIRKALMDSGRFELFTDDAHTRHNNLLKRGDLLLQDGHHIVVVLDTAEETVGKPYRVYNCVACCLRTEGSTKGKILAYLHPNDIVTLYGWATTGWGKVTTADGKTGYVSPKYLTPARQVKSTGKVWLRSGAGTNNNALTVIPNGAIIPWDGRTAKNGNTTWYYLSYGGYNGYASGLYIKPI